MATASLLLLLLLHQGGCGSNGAMAGDDHHEDTPATPGVSDRVAIPATIRRNLGITFAAAEKRHVANTIRVPGSFELQPLARHEYRMTLPGRVEFLVEQYAEVAPGDVLFRFRSPQWPELQHEIIQGEQEMSSALAEIEVAEAKLEETKRRLESVRDRIAALAAADFRQADLETQALDLEASLPRMESELRLAQTKLVNADRTYEHAIHRAAAAIGTTEPFLLEEIEHEGQPTPRYRTIDWIEVHATVPGVVESLAVADGAYVEPPSTVLSTVDPARVRFRAMALQSDLARFTGDLPARIVPPQSPGFDLTDAVEAEVMLGLEAHPDQRTITLIATPRQLRPWTRAGVSAFLEVVLEGAGEPRLAIPRSAVVKDGITHVFFRRDPKKPDEAIRVEADLGVDDGRWVVINSGLRIGDEVVLDGVYELKLATARTGGPPRGGHMHADGTFHVDH